MGIRIIAVLLLLACATMAPAAEIELRKDNSYEYQDVSTWKYLEIHGGVGGVIRFENPQWFRSTVSGAEILDGKGRCHKIQGMEGTIVHYIYEVVDTENHFED